MPRFMVVALGADRPGVVAAVSSVLVERRCNLGDTQMAVLQGYATMMLVVDAPPGETAEELQRALDTGATGLGHTFWVEPIGTVADDPPAGSRWRMRVYASDRPGIVFEVTRLLAEEGINIAAVETRLAGGVGALNMELDVPPGVDGAAVAERLDRLGEALGLTCSMRPAEV